MLGKMTPKGEDGWNMLENGSQTGSPAVFRQVFRMRNRWHTVHLHQMTIICEIQVISFGLKQLRAYLYSGELPVMGYGERGVGQFLRQ